MKLKQLFESQLLTDEKEIRDWLETNLISSPSKVVHASQPRNKDYNIENGVVDVWTNIHIPEKLKEIKVQFGHVHGSFGVTGGSLTSMIGCPKKVTNTFYPSGPITSLEGLPEEVGVDCNLFSTEITSFKGIDKKLKKLGGGIYLPTTATHLLDLMKIHDAKFFHSSASGPDRLVNALKILNKHYKSVKETNKAMIECQRELLANDLDEYA